MTPNQIAILIVVLVVGIRIARARKPRALHPNRLWIPAAVATLGISMGLWFQPHATFGLVNYAGFALAVAFGVVVGRFRAKTFRLVRDPETGQLMMHTHILTLLLLIGLIAVRSGIRAWAMESGSAVDAGAIIDALMVFALAMIVTQQITIWQRAKEVAPYGVTTG